MSNGCRKNAWGFVAVCRLGVRRRRGFTLIELLVVVAIISLIIAILLPALRNARRQTTKVACLSNLKGLATAWMSYLNANEERFLRQTFPPTMPAWPHLNYGGRQGTASEYGGGVPKLLNPYVGKPLILEEDGHEFQCKADRGNAQAATNAFTHYGTSYRMNTMLVGPPALGTTIFGDCVSLVQTINTKLPGLTLSRVSPPEVVLLMGDFGWEDTWNPQSMLRNWWHDVPCKYNIGFVDGHAAFVRIRKGIHMNPDYRVVPFNDLESAACTCQEELPCQ